MSAARVQKLEALLARVTQRAAMARPASGVAAVLQQVAAPVRQVPAPVVTHAAPAVAVPPMRAPAASAPEITVGEEEYMDTDVEVSTEVVEVDVDDADEQAIHDEVAAAAAAEAEEAEERAPVSSRRPVAMQEEEHDEYAENPPRHTPPPESGRQPAAQTASPAPPLASERRPSAPPMGEPQVGGWREPGLEQPRSPSVVPPPAHLQPPPRPQAPAPTSPLSRAVAPGATATNIDGPAISLSASVGQPVAGGPPGGPAQVMRPEIRPNAEVAKIEGQIAVAEESSFGDLLDSSLDL